eukprot:5567990-Amphidinium_carterae.3
MRDKTHADVDMSVAASAAPNVDMPAMASTVRIHQLCGARDILGRDPWWRPVGLRNANIGFVQTIARWLDATILEDVLWNGATVMTMFAFLVLSKIGREPFLVPMESATMTGRRISPRIVKKDNVERWTSPDRLQQRILQGKFPRLRSCRMVRNHGAVGALFLSPRVDLAYRGRVIGKNLLLAYFVERRVILPEI